MPTQPQYYYMGILPITPQNAPTLHRWARANQFLEEMVYQSLCPVSKEFRADISRRMLQNYGLFQGDPFLESHYWTTLAENFQKDGHLEDAWQALKLGLEKGYPFPQKYYYMGFFLFKAKHYALAKEAYLTAARLDPFFTPPPAALTELNRLIKTEQPVKPARVVRGTAKGRRILKISKKLGNFHDLKISFSPRQIFAPLSSFFSLFTFHPGQRFDGLPPASNSGQNRN